MPGAKTISVSVMNFKPVSLLQGNESRQINKIFNSITKDEYNKQNLRMVQELKKSPINLEVKRVEIVDKRKKKDKDAVVTNTLLKFF